MRSDDKAPGHKVRRNRDGTERHLWVARHDLVKAGYLPKTVRLHYDGTTRAGRLLIDAACRKLQAEMLEWASGRRRERYRFDGTIAGLVREYQREPASPYAELKWNTRRSYDHVLGIVEKAFGRRALVALGIGDFRRWYDEAKKPKVEGQPPRIRKAHGIIAMLRRLFAYGVTAELAECARLATILEFARFKQPGRRRVRMLLGQAEAIIATALASGRVSLALGTALQFETAMRQRDVIGEWEPLGDSAATGIVLGGRRWVNGLTWSDISADLQLRKETTKTGAMVSHDLRMAPLVTRVLAYVPPDRRVGPVIVDETCGRPYAEHAYGREWRKLADLAGVPRQVWNMDARAGAITEAEDAGADLDTIRGAVGHTQASTTARYSRGATGKSRKVAELRSAHRAAKNDQ